MNIAFSSSRNAASIERKILQYKTISIKLHHCILRLIKTQIFTLLDFLACVSIHCVNQKKHSNPDFLTKSVNNTLKTCVDIANEYMQAYNIGAGVKKLLFCLLHQYKCGSYTMFLFAFPLFN